MEKTPQDSESKIEPIVESGAMDNLEEGNIKNMFTKDEYQLATLG